MAKRMLNECDECGYIGPNGIWLIESVIRKQIVSEEYKVKSDIVDPEMFDLDVIDAKKLEKKYKITNEKAEELILGGRPICPKCKSKNFFIK